MSLDLTGLIEFPRPDAPVSVRSWFLDVAEAARMTLKPPPYPQGAAHGAGQTVMVLPGFGAPDATTTRLRGFLAAQGFRPLPWGLGLNLGPVPTLLDRLETRIRDEACGGPIALVGVSMGGCFAREMARRVPDRISRVVTLGTPVRLPVVSALAPAARAAALLWDADAAPVLRDIAAPVPVPLTAIVSRDDGVIDWRGSIPDDPLSEVVEITGAHSAMGSNPQAQRAVAQALARTAG